VQLSDFVTPDSVSQDQTRKQQPSKQVALGAAAAAVADGVAGARQVQQKQLKQEKAPAAVQQEQPHWVPNPPLMFSGGWVGARGGGTFSWCLHPKAQLTGWCLSLPLLSSCCCCRGPGVCARARGDRLCWQVGPHPRAHQPPPTAHRASTCRSSCGSRCWLSVPTPSMPPACSDSSHAT
jgi:hypothetical protein